MKEKETKRFERKESAKHDALEKAKSKRAKEAIHGSGMHRDVEGAEKLHKIY